MLIDFYWFLHYDNSVYYLRSVFFVLLRAVTKPYRMRLTLTMLPCTVPTRVFLR